jgi:hypothetical protein
VGVLESKMPTSSHDRHLAFQNPHSHFPFSQYPCGIMKNEAHEQYISGTPSSKGVILHIFLQPTRASFKNFYPQSFFGDGIIIQENQPNHELYMCSQLRLRASPAVLNT